MNSPDKTRSASSKWQVANGPAANSFDLRRAQQAADLQLLKHALRDNQRAWSQFHRRFEPTIKQAVSVVFKRYLGRINEADLDDYCAEVWATLLKDDRHKLRVYQASHCSLNTWIHRLARNCAIDQLRRRSSRPMHCDGCEPIELCSSEGHLCYAAPAEDQIDRQRQVALLYRAANRLNRNDRRFMQWHVVEERPGTEIAQRLGVSINTIYSQKHRLGLKLQRAVHALATA